MNDMSDVADITPLLESEAHRDLKKLQRSLTELSQMMEESHEREVLHIYALEFYANRDNWRSYKTKRSYGKVTVPGLVMLHGHKIAQEALLGDSQTLLRVVKQDLLRELEEKIASHLTEEGKAILAELRK